MPYFTRENCVYKKENRKKIGCTDGSIKKYLAALQMHAHESKDKSLDEVRLFVRKALYESVKKEKSDADDEIHLPELTMKKKDLIQYLKDLYNIELKNSEKH